MIEMVALKFLLANIFGKLNRLSNGLLRQENASQKLRFKGAPISKDKKLNILKAKKAFEVK